MNIKRSYYINYNGSHVGCVTAINEKNALRQARRKWGTGPYVAVEVK